MLLALIVASLAAVAGPPAPSRRVNPDGKGGNLPDGKLFNGEFFLAVGILGGSTYWDGNSSFSALDRCARCYEGNSFLYPFVQRGRGQGAFYAVQAGVDVGMLGLSLWLKSATRHSPHWVVRHLWLAPTFIVSGYHVNAAISNGRIPADPIR